MAGYKQTIQNLDPKMFITFDSDAYDLTHRTITALPAEFIDESTYENVCILHNDDDNFPAYRMGLPSLVQLEQDDQAGISFGWDGVQPSAPLDVWPKSWIEVAYQSWFSLLDNNGSFTVTWMMNRWSNEQAFRNYYEDMYPGYDNNPPARNNGLNRPIVRKGGAFDCYFQDNWNSDDLFIFAHPAGTFTINAADNPWLYGKNHHFALVWDVQETSPGTFTAWAKLFINGHIYASQMYTYLDDPLSTYAATPIEIGGTISGGGINKSDRNTSRVDMDQIALFDRGLSDDEIMRLYKKVRSYDQMILFENAEHYWTLGDASSSSNFTVTNMTGGYTGIYQGGNLKAVRASAPPANIGEGSSTHFQAGGSAIIRRIQPNNIHNPIFDANGNWTFHFWASIQNSERSVLAAIQHEVYPYIGIACEANMRNGIYKNGSIEFRLDENTSVNSLTHDDNGDPWMFNDSQDHHFALVHRANAIELWIDGRLHDSKAAFNGILEWPGPAQLYLMGMMPGKLSTTGRMSRVAYTPYALGAHEIRARAAFNRIWRIKGTITLQGIPHQATIRMISHHSGELIKEVLSSNEDGFYSADLFDGRLVDLMVLNKQDRNIKYRAYGPITPLGYEDLP